MSSKTFFSKNQQVLIINSISQAEKSTSGEVRVHLENNCKGDPIIRAIEVFTLLKMDQTKLENGVLFYFAIKSKKFAIIGGQGIDKVVPTDFWDSIRNEIIVNFKSGNYTEALINGILTTGEKLKKHFPYSQDDINELSNDISFEE
jgi:uncharacterized membrane protein